MSKTDYLPTLTSFLKALNKPAPQSEIRFHPPRRWRLDFGFPDHTPKIALEVEGGVWVSGRHNRGTGFIKDMEKYNQAVLDGWVILRATPQMVMNGAAALLLSEALDTL